MFDAPRLYALPKQAATQCRLAGQVRLCPTRLPRATIGYSRPRPPQLVAERYGPSRNGSGTLAGLTFGYGAPWEPDSGNDWRHHLWRNRPCCFLHFELWHAVLGTPPFPDDARRRSLGGHMGDYAPATGYGLACGPGNGGVFFCNHARFRWKQSGDWYVATLHRFGTESDTRRLLDRLIRQLRPA